MGDHGVEVDRWRVGFVTAAIHVELAESQSGDAVGQRVVELREQRAPAALEPVDQDEVPQRSRPVVRVLIELGRQVEQLPL